MNHKPRKMERAIITKEEAKDMVSNKLDVYSIRLALIPMSAETDALAYEFVGEYEGSTYYVYIGAVSGEELDIFKVINGTNGELLY